MLLHTAGRDVDPRVSLRFVIVVTVNLTPPAAVARSKGARGGGVAASAQSATIGIEMQLQAISSLCRVVRGWCEVVSNYCRPHLYILLLQCRPH